MKAIGSGRRARAVYVALAVAALAVGGAGILALRRPAAGPTARVASVVVRRGDFARKVRAEGVLKARTSTPLTAPGNGLSLKIGWMIDDGARVAKGDVVLRFDSSTSRRDLRTGTAGLRTADGKTTKERAESGAVVKNLGRDAVQARSDLEAARTFQSKDPDLFSRNEILEADIDVGLAERREGTARTTRGVREEISASSLELLAIERRKADLVVGKASKELAALEIRAPHDGIVVFQRDWRGELPQVGQTVWSGMTIAEIPDLATLQGEVWVLESDAGGLAVGRRATVTLEARPSAEIAGTIRRVDTLARPRQRGVPVQYLGADVELKTAEASTMKPGQRLVATLYLGEEKDVLAVPRQAIFEREGKKVAWRRRRGAWEAVPVTLGAAALGKVVVTAGLAGGDEVALADPTRPLAAEAGAAPGAPRGATGPPLPGGRS